MAAIIDSIQRGRLTNTADTNSSTISVSAVTLANSFSIVEYHCSASQGGGKGGGYLTATTTLTYACEGDGAGHNSLFWKVIEFA